MSQSYATANGNRKRVLGVQVPQVQYCTEKWAHYTMYIVHMVTVSRRFTTRYTQIYPLENFFPPTLPGICHLINYLLIRLEVSQVVVYVRIDMLRFETFISLKMIKICLCYYLGLGRLKTTHIIRESLKGCSRRVCRPIGSRPLQEASNS